MLGNFTFHNPTKLHFGEDYHNLHRTAIGSSEHKCTREDER